MSASKRASETIHDDLLLECAAEKHLPQDVCGKMSAVIAAEYAPLIKAAEMARRYFEGRGYSDTRAPILTALIKALAHIEGDATP